MRVLACLFFSIVTGTMMPLAGSELPRNSEARSTEAEPLVLIPTLDKNRSTTAASASRQTGSPNSERIENELEHARKTVTRAERLFKKGVLSRVEVEQRSLRVVELESQLKDARLEQVRQEMELQKARLARGEISPADLARTEQLLAGAAASARTAAAKRDRAEMEAAEKNLRRQRKLMAQGSGEKSDLIRAEERLAELKSPKR